ncbi:sensor domain-containing diguanylate cyclase [Zavarzinia compransoris]|uniref:sensor domain-containing diguanylate cyclase n=1 Tax=Zavarzinia marina TaxID=2911065 RepID=UPI001F411A0F|nr:diguanylate cyclase [Zavarzinia marina]MCF4165843.1 sensor domain-containing diguanylate cyclase [Zavarzinia marina]
MSREAMEEKVPFSRPSAAAVLDRLVESHPGPALIVGQGIRVVESNDAARPLIEALRAGHGELIDLLDQTRNGTEGHRAEIVLVSGKVFDVAATPIGAAVLLTARDLTGERQRIGRFAEQAARLADIMDCLSDFAFETDREGRFVFCAPDVAFGYRTSSLIGHYAVDLLDGDWLEGRSDPFIGERALAGVEVWLAGADGTRVVTQMSARPVLDDLGRCVGLRGFLRDLSGVRARETALTQALDRERLRGAVVDAMRGAGGPERAIRVAAEASLASLHAQGALVMARDADRRMNAVLGLGDAGAALGAEVSDAVTRIAAQDQVAGRVETRAVGAMSALIALAVEGGVAVGAIVLLRPRHLPWTGIQAGILSAVADQLGLVLGIRERVGQLERLSRIDALTGILNRRAFDNEMPGRLRQADRDAGGVLLLVDLDDFKPVNDRFGHAMGDKALSLMGAAFRGLVGRHEMVARLGGDEFAFWLPGCDGQQAFARADAFHGVLYDLDRRPDMPSLGLGMSIGIAEVRTGSGENLDNLMARADAALYRAKQGGRNRTELAPRTGKD